jgi:hypothetical protein
MIMIKIGLFLVLWISVRAAAPSYDGHAIIVAAEAGRSTSFASREYSPR